MWKRLGNFAAKMEKQHQMEIDKAIQEKEMLDFMEYLHKKGHDRLHSPDVFRKFLTSTGIHNDVLKEKLFHDADRMWRATSLRILALRIKKHYFFIKVVRQGQGSLPAGAAGRWQPGHL
jgi:hypothetical protein